MRIRNVLLFVCLFIAPTTAQSTPISSGLIPIGEPSETDKFQPCESGKICWSGGWIANLSGGQGPYDASKYLKDVLGALFMDRHLGASFEPYVGNPRPKETMDQWGEESTTFGVVVPSESYSDSTGLWACFDVTITNTLIKRDNARYAGLIIDHFRYLNRGVLMATKSMAPSSDACTESEAGDISDIREEQLKDAMLSAVENRLQSIQKERHFKWFIENKSDSPADGLVQ